MARDRKVSIPKFRPSARSAGEWVTEEIPSAALEYALSIRVTSGRSTRKISPETLSKIGRAFSLHRQTSEPPPRVDAKQAGELREVIAELIARIDGMDDGLSLAIAVAWQKHRYGSSGFDLSDPQAPKNRWPATRHWLQVLDAGLEHAIAGAHAGKTGGRPGADARDRLLADVTRALADDGLPEPRAREAAAALLAEARIRLPNTTRRVRAACKRGGRKP